MGFSEQNRDIYVIAQCRNVRSLTFMTRLFPVLDLQTHFPSKVHPIRGQIKSSVFYFPHAFWRRRTAEDRVPGVPKAERSHEGGEQGRQGGEQGRQEAS